MKVFRKSYTQKPSFDRSSSIDVVWFKDRSSRYPVLLMGPNSPPPYLLPRPQIFNSTPGPFTRCLIESTDVILSPTRGTSPRVQ